VADAGSYSSNSDQRLHQAMRRGDAATVESAIQAGASPAGIRLQDILALPYTEQPALIAVMQRHGMPWGISSDRVLFQLVGVTMLTGDQTQEQYDTQKIAVANALVAAGFRFAPTDIRNETRQYVDLRQPHALAVLRAIAERSGNMQAYIGAIDEADAKMLAAEKAKYDAAQRAATQARVEGAKICKTVRGEWSPLVTTALGTHISAPRQATTFFVTGFTEQVSGKRIQIRIAGIRAPLPATQEFQNVSRVDGDTVLIINNLIWDDSMNWSPCE
jgi:hypothetical protein